jgi:hypothetical protein
MRIFSPLILFLLVMLWIGIGTTYSATDGTLGATSSGSVGISITIPTLVRITNVQNLDLGTFTGSGDLSANDSVCIYTNLSAGTYKITASGDGTAGAFEVRNGSAVSLPYLVFWNDQPSPSGGIALVSGTASPTQGGADISSQTCSGLGNNANFMVRMLESVLQGAIPDVYTGTLSLVIEPA